MLNLPLGLEVELYTGTPRGRVVGRSAEIAQRLSGFVCEPDARNTEYVTPPLRDITALQQALLEPRQRLRRLLGEHGLTIVPGSTLPLNGDTAHFVRSAPNNAYHTRIEQAYGTRVVTTSIHFNFGVDDTEALMRACRLLRLEAPVALALTASSPFLEGEPTGFHSTRWATFPRTPEVVPLFRTHRAYVDYIEQQLASGVMWNVRHLWSAARPNGPDRPLHLDRLEVRICDLTLDIPLTCAVGLLLMRRVQAAIDGLDPLDGRDPEALLAMCDANEQAVARASLDAEIIDWRDGRRITARNVAAQWLDDARGAALDHPERQVLRAVDDVLDNGNDAMRWLREHRRGRSVETIVTDAIAEAQAREESLACSLA